MAALFIFVAGLMAKLRLSVGRPTSVRVILIWVASNSTTVPAKKLRMGRWWGSGLRPGARLALLSRLAVVPS